MLNLALQDEIDQPFFWVPSIEGPTFAEGRGLGWLLGNPALGLSWHDGAPPLGWETTALYCVLPVALVITQAISLSLSTPPPTGEEDDSTKRIQLILKFLPLLIGFFAANVRARRRPRDARARSGTGKPPPPSLRAPPQSAPLPACGGESARARKRLSPPPFSPLFLPARAQVPNALGLYWMTSNLFSTASSLGVKAYIKANPPDIQWDVLEKQEERRAQDRLPESIEDAIFEARNNLRPDTTPRWAPPAALSAATTTDPDPLLP